MKNLLRIFFSAPGHNPWTVLCCVALAGAAQGFGVATLVPLLQAVDGNLESADNPISLIVVQVFESLGVQPEAHSILALFVVSFLLKPIFMILAMTYVGYAVAEVATNLRFRLVAALLNVKWRYFTKQPLGTIANAISLETHRSANAYAFVARMFSNFSQAVFCVVGVLLIAPWVALFSLIVGFVIAAILAPFVGISRRAGQRQTLRTRELVKGLTDALISIKPLKAMARQVGYAQLFGEHINSLKVALRQQAISREMLVNLKDVLVVIGFAIAFYVVVVAWGTDAAQFLILAFLILEIVYAINRVQQMIQEASAEESAYAAVHQLIEQTETDSESMTAGIPPTFQNGCALRDVYFSYGDKPVLNGVSMDIDVGKLTVITGNSGAGKSTITDLLIGLYEPDNGQVLVDGVPLSRLDLAKWRASVGYVPQEVILFHDTIRNNVALGDPSFSDQDIRTALEAAGIWDFVEGKAQGLETIVGERGTKISGGQRQRVALARALVHKPKFLILDEPTSALDSQTELEICRYARELVTEQQDRLAVLAVTHGRTWLDIADRVYHLGDEGQALVAA